VADRRRAFALLLPVLAACAACAHSESLAAAREPPRESMASAPERALREEVQVGYATWYGARLAGRTTASGERFDPSQMTAAHRSLPFGTWVEVRRVDTGETVRVRITDRGPYGPDDRIIDLSSGAAKRIGMLKAGVARVQIRIVEGP
jgi:rare lipoprotein A